MKQITLLFFVLISFSTIAQHTHKKIDSLIAKTLKENNIPALTASVIKLDTIFYGINGVKKIGSKQKVALANKFHLGSNTKAITSFIAMKMVEENKLSLKTKFIDLFPELKTKINASYQSITLFDLLSHRARIHPYNKGIEYKKLPELKGNIHEKRLQFAKFVLNQPPVIEDTKPYTYSNAGYLLASLMLEKISGKTYEELLEFHFQKLKLDYFIGFPNKENNKNPWGHWQEGNKLVAHSPSHPYKLYDFMLPAGDVSMNIIDYSKFIQFHLQGLNNSNNYLSKESYNKMHFGNEKYALGWANSIKNVMHSTHNGSVGTYFSHTMIFPKRKLAIIILTNTGTEFKDPIYKLREMLQNEFKTSI